MDPVEGPSEDALTVPPPGPPGGGTAAADNLDSVLEEPAQEGSVAKFRPKLRPKPGKVSSKVVGTDGRPQPSVGGEKGKGKSVSFAPPDASGVDTNSEMGKSRHSCNDKLSGESLSSLSQQTTEKNSITEEQYSNVQERNDNENRNHEEEPSELVRETGSSMKQRSGGKSQKSGTPKHTDDHVDEGCVEPSLAEADNEEQYSNVQEHSDNENWNHEGEPSDHVRESGSSMKLRSRRKSQKSGTPKHADDYVDEGCVEPSLAEEDNDSGDNYTAGTKRKARKKSRDSVEESQQQKVQKEKSQVSSRGRKRTLKDEMAEKPEKKLSHSIRQRRAKEINSLLEKPREEIDHMKLSAAHLRLLQEARERVNAKENPSGPSSNISSFQLDDMDDLDYRDEEERNFDNDRTENYVQNVKKLNYHSYMNKQTRGKWSKSDTDMFYKGLRQFGSDFAMIQQLLPDKTRHQVRAKFKTEEKKNPLLVHDAIINRSGDNLCFKTVIKKLNIEDDALQEVNNTRKQDGASNEVGPQKKNAQDDFIEREEDELNWSDEEQGVQMPDVQEEHASGNNDDDDGLGDVFDWY